MKGISAGLKMIGVMVVLLMLSMLAMNTIGKDALLLILIVVLSVGITTIIEVIEDKV